MTKDHPVQGAQESRRTMNQREIDNLIETASTPFDVVFEDDAEARQMIAQYDADVLRLVATFKELVDVLRQYVEEPQVSCNKCGQSAELDELGRACFVEGCDGFFTGLEEGNAAYQYIARYEHGDS